MTAFRPPEASPCTIPKHPSSFTCSAFLIRAVPLAVTLLLCACSTVKYTVDDGRAIDPAILRPIQSFSTGEQAIRPAIARSATVLDKQCDKQWELPISVATSYEFPELQRVAWARVAKVDERLTVVGSSMMPALSPGDKIVEIDGYKRDNTEKMALELVDRRDRGAPFTIRTDAGKLVKVVPFQACRGYTRLAPPSTPQLQDYHWLLSFHPLEVTQQPLTDDEALWIVLWTQGLSEEGGARMKTYHYGTKILGAVYNVVTIATGVRGMAAAAQAAASAAQKIAASQLTDVLKKQLIDQAVGEVRSRVQDSLLDNARKFTQAQAIAQMQVAAANRGTLQGVAWVGGTVFDQADAWAFARMPLYDADPLAPFTLHQKLIEASLARNAFVFDPDRLKSITGIAEKQGRGDDALAILRGVNPTRVELELSDMPMASIQKPVDLFAADDAGADGPANFGYVEALLQLPLESGK
jgi:hypothetical protein